MSTYHGDGSDVLLLLHIDVRNVEPDVGEISSGLTHLSEDVS